MRYSPLICAVAITILTSCSGDPKQYQKPENAAMSSVHVPLYAGITDIMQNTSFKSLKPGNIVYFMPDTAVGNGVGYVKVTWADSSAYARADQLMPNGKWAVLTANGPYSNVAIYDNPDLQTPVESTPGRWMLTVAGDPVGNAIPVFYPGMQGLLQVGYIGSDFIYTDKDNVDYYNELNEAMRRSQQGDDEMLIVVSRNPRYKNLLTYSWNLNNMAIADGDIDERGDAETGEDDSPYAEGDAEYGDYYDEAEVFAAERGWMMYETLLPEEEVPATFRKLFVFEDGTEMNAEGYQLANRYPWSQSSGSIEKTVKKIRFELTPKSSAIVSISIDTFYEPGSEYNTSFNRADDAGPKKPFSVVVEDIPGTMIFCSVIRAEFVVGQKTAIATVRAECGD